MKNIFVCAVAFTAITCFASCGNNTGKDSKEVAKDENAQKFDSTNIQDDTKFAITVADAGMFEVAASQLALQNAQASNVKDFATMMVTDHTAANNELKETAAKKNISLPAQLSDAHQKKYDDLSTKKGADFDKAYVDCMLDGHKDAVAAFQKESDKGNDNDLKTWAGAKLPTLQHHLEVIQSIKDSRK